jgi:hypothetical protein
MSLGNWVISSVGTTPFMAIHQPSGAKQARELRTKSFKEA